MDSSPTLKNSYLGSFYQPPDRILAPRFTEYRQQSSPKTGIIGSKKFSSVTPGIPSAPNGHAVILALKTLQEKIRHLELERVQAEDNFKRLSSEAALSKKVMEQKKPGMDVVHGEVKQNNERSMQLSAAEARSALLEKQLEYMRKMVENAQMETNIALEKQASLQVEKIQEQTELHTKLGKLEFLEKECLKLSATQSMAQDKIKQLEQKLLEEEHHRKLIQDKAAQLQTGLEINRILSSSSPQNKPQKKVKKKQLTKKIGSATGEPSEPEVCRKLGGLPFVAGKSTSQSHSVRANVQNILYMLKHYDTRSCERAGSVAECRSRGRRVCRPVPSHSLSSSTSEGLSELLLALQDELGQMSFEHQELVKQIQDTRNDDVRDDLERELDSLVKQMEIKGNQISMLKKHETSVQKLKQKSQKTKKRAASAESRGDEQKGIKEIPITPRGKERKSTPGQKSKESLQLLKNVQKLQMTLKRDDIAWEQ